MNETVPISQAAPNPIIQSMFGIQPFVAGIVAGRYASESIFKGPYARSMLMGVYLGGLLSGIVLRYITSDGTSVFPLAILLTRQQNPNLVLAAFEACVVCEYFNLLCTKRKFGGRELHFFCSIFCAAVLRIASFSALLYTDGDSKSGLQALVNARPWLPSIDCDLIRKGEPDIVGPGVNHMESDLMKGVWRHSYPGLSFHHHHSFGGRR